MGKIKQGILGGFSGKVGTVVGSYWNGIFYMKGLPQSYKKGRSSSQKMQQGYFKELVTLSMSLSNEDLEFIYPKKPKGMTRRNLLVKQLERLEREKLEEDPNEPKLIKTVWGTGYCLEIQE